MTTDYSFSSMTANVLLLLHFSYSLHVLSLSILYLCKLHENVYVIACGVTLTHSLMLSTRRCNRMRRNAHSLAEGVWRTDGVGIGAIMYSVYLFFIYVSYTKMSM